jgi:membrane associated rhomboid family serine protease
MTQAPPPSPELPDPTVPPGGASPWSRDGDWQVPTATPPAPTVPVCFRHPKRETYVRCTRCDRPICPECMNEASVGFQCPECVAEGRRTVRTVRTVFGGTRAGTQGYVTKTLIAINVLFQIASMISASGLGGRAGSGVLSLLMTETKLTRWGAVLGQMQYVNPATGQQFWGPGGIADGEYYRLFTSMFLHYGLVHLAMNMWALWVLGRTLEAALGPVRFAVLYMVAGIGGAVSVYLFQPNAATAGASGAIFGLFAALFVILKRLKRDTSSIIPILVVNVLISFIPGISLFGHLGGAVVGGLVALVIAYAPQQRRNWMLAGSVATLLVLFVIAVVVQTNHLQAFIPIPA